MLVGVCDFPGDYLFPPTGYGGIERWLWAVAIGARRVGAEVHLLGPRWRSELADDWVVHPIRLEGVTPGGHQARSLRDAGYDLLVAGHEYPSLPAWHFKHHADAFDGVRSRLYCYSEEMRDRYARNRPITELAVH